MDKQEARLAEMDARHHDSIAWRNTVREEDRDWRQTLRKEDKEWRQTVREEDKGWRESEKEWRQSTREDDKRMTKRCCALTAAVQSSKTGASPETIFALAKVYEAWLDGKDD